MAELAGVTVAPPLPNPPWVRWDHTGSGVWPAIGYLDNRDQSAVPGYVADIAERARRRILAAGLPRVLGHADFEAQNARWHGQGVEWAASLWPAAYNAREQALHGHTAAPDDALRAQAAERLRRANLRYSALTGICAVR